MLNLSNLVTPVMVVVIVVTGFTLGLWFAVVELKTNSSMAIVAGLVVAVIAGLLCAVIVRFTR